MILIKTYLFIRKDKSLLNYFNLSRDPAQLLITFNARLNAQDIRGNTPLHYCIQFNNLVVMRILLDKGASLEVKNNNVNIKIRFRI